MIENISDDKWHEMRMQEHFDSRKEELLGFYRKYFDNEADAEAFIIKVYKKTTIDSNVHLRMMNNIKRFATIMDDVKNKAEVKLFFLITCIESLYNLVNRTNLGKRDILKDFINNYLLEDDKQIIIKGIEHSLSDDRYMRSDDGLELDEIADLLSELRNKLAHDGVYGYFSFGDGKCPIINCINLYIGDEIHEAREEIKAIQKQSSGIKINLDEYKKNEKYMRTYDINLTFDELKDILVRGMINFIKQYIDNNIKS